MPNKKISRHRFRWVSSLCLILTPCLGGLLVMGGKPALAVPDQMLTAVMIWSVIVHFVLAGLFAETDRKAGVPILATSLLCLIFLAATPVANGSVPGISGSFVPLNYPEILFFWIFGVGSVLLSRLSWTLIPTRMTGFSVPLRNPIHLTVTAIVLAGCFLLAQSLRPILNHLPPGLSSVSGAFADGLFALTASALILQGMEVLRERDSDTRPAPLMVVLAFLCGLSVLALVMALPELAPIGQVGGIGTLLLTAALISVVLVRSPSVLLGAGLVLTAAAMAFNASQTIGGPVLQSVFLVLLISVLFIIGQPNAHAKDPVATVGRAPTAVKQLFHKASQTWLVNVDLDHQTLRFPGGTGESLGYGELVRFDEAFSGSDFSGLIDLVQALHGDTKTLDGPISIQLTRGSRNRDKGNTPRLMTFAAHILSTPPADIWIALVSLEREREISTRLARYEQLLGEAILREERLLSIASHELRTPIAILSMLGEELKSGTDWEDVGAGFEKTLERIITILDDLRAGSGAGGTQTSSGGFTIREIAQQVQDIFSPAAVSNGITLTFTPAKDSDTLFQSDQNRVLIALSKLTHNAIIHSQGRQVSISAFVAKGTEDERIITWQVTDDGVGVAAGMREKIFEPFETDMDNPDERPGLGLYTARKAIRLIGGDLVLHNDGAGSRFVMTHPARAARHQPRHEQEVVMMNDVTPIYQDRCVLLVEDNKLVGEITSNRLRKLFKRVDWAESGDAGLTLFRENSYDMIVVDQLLPGLIGSELVREVRQTHKDIPIIGITASTMGSECRDLEEAGANYALEKPLSFGQMKSLADEFFGPAEDDGN